MLNRIIQFLIGVSLLAMALACSDSKDYSKENMLAVEKMKEAAHSEEFWVQVHAIEFLLQLGHGEWVDSSFHKWYAAHDTIPQKRIGVWRIGAKAAIHENRRQEYLEKIIAAYRNTDGPDRIHAAETLAKLGIPLRAIDAELVKKDLDTEGILRPYVVWGASLPAKDGAAPDFNFILRAFESGSETERDILSYALVKMDSPFPKPVSTQIRHFIEDLELSPVAKSRLNLALILWDSDFKKSEEFSSSISDFLTSNNKSVRYEYCEAMALIGGDATRKALSEILHGQHMIMNDKGEINRSSNLDCQSAAAFALVSIQGQQSTLVPRLDWLIIILFLLGMVGIGYFYSRQSKNKEDYLLGGRKMNPFMVGLSLFATLLSTLSYLAYPGEMIKYGPMVFFGILAFPVAYWIVGKFLIPRLMEMNVTSAYEILEIKLGNKTRNLGTLYFLLLRFLWMSTIIYATVNTALIHIIGFSASWVPIICVVIALITVLYTVLGGIKAVVMTDAIQSVVMFGGAFLAILIISYQFEPFLGWFPKQWMPHWEELTWRIDFQQRMTIGNIFIMTLVWQVCTAGSDQMAIQRYLSTGSVKQANRTYKISLISSGVIQVILAILGLAISAFFLKFPENLLPGTNVYDHADSLFPRFVLIGLPPGITGLVVAGIAAAAMSSLSSGLNSASSVISEDVLDRHFPQFLRNMSPLKKVRVVSVVLGLVVSVCSMFIGYIEGNLLDVVIKVVNLVVAPLFVLFFMALFVPGATDRGTFFGGIFSLFVAILIAFFGIFNLSVLTIMPVSLVAGIVASWILSKFG